MDRRFAAVLGLLMYTVVIAAHPGLHNPLSWTIAVDKIVTARHEPQVRLHVNVTAVHGTEEWAEVSWHGVDQPAVDDWVALFVPASAIDGSTAPVKYQLAMADPKHLESGAGMLRFLLQNHRQDMRFAFVRGGLTAPRVVGASHAIDVAHANYPMHIHLALTRHPSEMVVQWTTRNSQAAVVRWGTRSQRYMREVDARHVSYSRDDLCGAPASTVGWIDAGRQHYAVLKHLQPSRTYYYVVGDAKSGLFSEEHSFTTLPAAGHAGDISMFVVADVGQAERDGSNVALWEYTPALHTTARMTAHASSRRHHAVLHVGDISYACGYGAQWDTFMQQIQPLAASMPYMVAIGNHERDWPHTGDAFRNDTVRDSGGECGVPFEHRLLMPTRKRDTPWYSFDIGSAHIIVYSTEHATHAHSPQHQFIERDMRAVDRCRTPWLIVAGHRPMYVDSWYGGAEDSDQLVARRLRDDLESLLMEHQVDLVFHGHHHSYQRTCAVRNGSCVAVDSRNGYSAPVHIITGHGGAALFDNLVHPRPEIFERVMLTWGFIRMTINATSLRIKVENSTDGAMLDEFEMTKSDSWQRHINCLAPSLLAQLDGHAMHAEDGAQHGALWRLRSLVRYMLGQFADALANVLRSMTSIFEHCVTSRLSDYEEWYRNMSPEPRVRCFRQATLRHGAYHGLP